MFEGNEWWEFILPWFTWMCCFCWFLLGLQHGKSLFFTIISENRFGTFSGKSKGKVEWIPNYHILLFKLDGYKSHCTHFPKAPRKFNSKKPPEKLPSLKWNWLVFQPSIFRTLLLMEEILHHLGYINLVNNGINYQPQLGSRISEPSTVC